VKNYVMENIVDRLTQGKLVSCLIRYWSTKWFSLIPIAFLIL
jgi:hypothetical protein